MIEIVNQTTSPEAQGLIQTTEHQKHLALLLQFITELQMYALGDNIAVSGHISNASMRNFFVASKDNRTTSSLLSALREGRRMEVSIRCVCNEDTLGADIIIYSGNSVLFVWQIMVTETGDLLSVDSRF